MAATKSIYLWSSIDRIGNSVMTFGANIVLARLLDPADFGLLCRGLRNRLSAGI